MSYTFDGALSNVLPTNAESKRALTPSKLFTRPITPQRSNSAPRSNSNNRDIRSSDIAHDPHVDRRSRSGAISTRKLRRWENKNLFGVENFSKNKEDRILESLNNPELGMDNTPFEITWRSTLSRLLRPENQVLLNDFLTCRDVFTTGAQRAQGPRKARSAHRCDWNDAEEAWMKVEKRIRAAISRSFASSDVIEDFLAQLEQVILHFVHTKQALSANKLSDELKKELAQPISVDRSGNLLIPLHESPFRRLLVHGVAQFYGLQSHSVKGKNDTFKSCLIKLPKVTASIVPTPATASEQPVAPASPVSSPNTTSKVPRTSSALPATATRCLSLVRYLTLVHEQQLAQQAHNQVLSQVQNQVLSGPAGEAATDKSCTTVAHQTPIHAHGQMAEVRSSSGAVAAGAASSSGAALHVMSALERRLASLTVQDVSSLVATPATTAHGSDGLAVLSLRNQPSGSESPNATDLHSDSSSPVVISPSDLHSTSRVLDGEDRSEGLSDHVLLSPTPPSQRAPPPLSVLNTASEDYVVV